MSQEIKSSSSLIAYVLCYVSFTMSTSVNASIVSHLPATDELTPDPSNDWFNKLVFNLIGYSIILIPINVLVFMVKHHLCTRSVQNLPLVRTFVYGKEVAVIQDDEEMQSMLTEGEEEPSNGSPGMTKRLKYKNSDPGNRMSNYFKVSNDRLATFGLLAYCFFGLQFSYLTWGVLQEKIMTTEYVINLGHTRETSIIAQLNEKGQLVAHFQDSQFLVLVNRVLAFIFAAIGITLFQKKNAAPPLASEVGAEKVYAIAPLYEFVFCSLSNILSSWCQYEALKFVNFPTQVLSKACKILPVMLMSQVVGGKRYKFVDYFLALTISLGMTLFLLGNYDNHAASKGHLKATASSSTGYYPSYKTLDGIFILVLYLTFDSFTSNWQGKLFEKYKISTWQMMAAINFYSLLLTFTSLTGQGDFMPAFRILSHCSALAWDCVLLSFCSAAGQLFVYYTIATFGPLTFVTIMTLRQALAILLSCFLYSHPLSFVSIIGVCVVFGSLFTQTYRKLKKK